MDEVPVWRVDHTIGNRRAETSYICRGHEDLIKTLGYVGRLIGLSKVDVNLVKDVSEE